MTETSLVVLLTAYNASRFIAEAVRSVLGQTYPHFEFIIIDDGSTDDTAAVVRAAAGNDPRLHLVRQANQGMGASLNDALAACSATWVARMDADDIMEPHRLERQMAYVRAHPGLDVVSSFVLLIDEDGRIIGRGKSDLTTPEVVRAHIARKQAIGFHHPAVLARRQAVLDVGGYRPQFWPVDDFDLWNRMAERGCALAVMPEYLLRYRIHATSVSVARTHEARLRHGWAKACIAARREDRHEPSWDDYLGWRQRLPLGQRIHTERRDWARVFYKAAALHYSRRRYARLLGCLAVAGVLEPGYVLRHLLSKYGRP